MNKKAIILLPWIIVALVVFGWDLRTTAGDALKGNDKTVKMFPGSSSSIDAAYSNATSIIEGIVTDEGVISPESPGEAYCEGLEIRIVRGYKGSFVTNQTVKVNVLIRTFPANRAETAPKSGETLICFIENKSGKAARLNKVLAATREARNAVYALVENERGGIGVSPENNK